MWIGDEWSPEPGMTCEQQRQCFELRMALSAAGYNWRAVYPDGQVARFVTISESGIRMLGTDYGAATLTAIVEPDGHLTLVTKCPLTAAEREAMEAQRVADEEAARLARVEEARTRERDRKAAKRRAEGKLTRAEWLAKHSEKPWIALTQSKSTYYRNKRRDGSGGAGAEKYPPCPGPHGCH